MRITSLVAVALAVLGATSGAERASVIGPGGPIPATSACQLGQLGERSQLPPIGLMTSVTRTEGNDVIEFWGLLVRSPFTDPTFENDTAFTIGVSAVPEPSTWLMMLMGFAGLGFAGYLAAWDSRSILGKEARSGAGFFWTRSNWAVRSLPLISTHGIA